MIQIIKCPHCNGYGVNYCENCGKRLIKERPNKVIAYQEPCNSDFLVLKRKKRINSDLSKLFLLIVIIISIFTLIAFLIPRNDKTEPFITVINAETGDSIELSQFEYNIFGTDHLDDFGSYMPLFIGDNLSELDKDDFNDYDYYDNIIIQVKSNNYTDYWLILNLNKPNIIKVNPR